MSATSFLVRPHIRAVEMDHAERRALAGDVREETRPHAEPFPPVEQVEGRLPPTQLRRDGPPGSTVPMSPHDGGERQPQVDRRTLALGSVLLQVWLPHQPVIVRENLRRADHPPHIG